MNWRSRKGPNPRPKVAGRATSHAIAGVPGESGYGESAPVNVILGFLPADGRVCGGGILFKARNISALGPAEFAPANFFGCQKRDFTDP